MKIEYWRDHSNRANVFQASVDDSSLSAAASPQAVMAEVRHQLAKAIVDKIMEKIGPALDAALKEIGHP